MIRKILIAATLSLPLLPGAACTGNNSRKDVTSDSAAAESYPLPQVPATVTAPEERASIAAARFWDGAVFAAGVDTVTPALEQAFANFAAIAPLASERDSVSRGVATVLRRGGAELIMPLAERYLFDPNSPLRSEELFILFLEQAPEWPRSEGLLELARMNREGTPAADFPFVDARGTRGSLGEFVSAHGTTFVYFYDSECDVCKSLIPAADAMAGDLPVIAVCPESNAAAFEQTLSLFPEDWTVVRDLGEIDADNLYYFPALPSVYVLGSDMTVLAKDAPVE